ncbi:MAG TPA: hypothetical protein VGS19_35660 [Streptosporangiaceae bacterium]|nr:hypothetical protein [Streptosporangiaceae bacterium]
MRKQSAWTDVHYLLTQGRRVFDLAGSPDGEESDYAVPWWRMNMFVSLLAARLGDEKLAGQSHDAATAALPASLPRFSTHLDMHQGLMLARAGDPAGGAACARAAPGKLPPENTPSRCGCSSRRSRTGHRV